MKPTKIALLLMFAFSLNLYANNPVSDAAVKTSVQKYIDTQLKTDSLFINAVVGILAIDENGKTIGEWNSNYPLLTASTLKTVTTGLGLCYLGPDYTYKTKVGYKGEIKDSVLNGDIFIIGGGDPTLASRDTIAYSIDSIFGVWTDAIKEKGIKKIDGNIIVDDSWLVREQMPDSWSWGNFGAYYGSTASGLSFCENVQYYTLKPGQQVGDTATVTADYPVIPGMKLINQVTTGKAKSSDNSNYYVQDLSLTSKYSGTIPIDRRIITSENSNRFPQLSCGYHFREYLNAHSIECSNDIVDAANICSLDNSQPIIIAQTSSAELWKIVNVTNRISNNFFAETILKTIGKEMTGVGSYDSSIVAVRKLLDEYGVGTKGFDTRDGSGLSRQDFVTPKFFCKYYSMMAENGIFAKFFESFPYPGGNGTLKNVLKNTPNNIKKRIHAKSGSLTGVRCYAGYVEGQGDRGLIKFAILVNNYSASTSKMQPKIEHFLLELALCK